MRVSDDRLQSNQIWLLNGIQQEDVPDLPDTKAHEFLDIIYDLRDLRAAAREAVKYIEEELCFENWHEYDDDPTRVRECPGCKERKDLIDKLREAVGGNHGKGE